MGEMYLHAGMFGKVLSHPDFVRLNAGGRLARLLDSWMQAGLADLRRQGGRGWEEVFDAAQPLSFLYRHTNPSEGIAGWFGPSQDATGRRYPLIFFSEVPLDRNGRDAVGVPASHGEFCSAAEEIANLARKNGIVADSQGRISNLSNLLPKNRVEITRMFDDHLSDATMGSFWRGIFGDSADPRKYLVTRNLFSALAPLRGREASRIKVALRLPIESSLLAVRFNVGVWLMLARAIVGDRGFGESSVFWSEGQDGGGASCCLFFQPPTAAQWVHMIAPQFNSETIWDTRTIGADALDSARAALGDAIAEALDSPDLRIEEFINRI